MNIRLFNPEATTVDPVVVTGIGLITSLGADRESVWTEVRQGRSGVRRLHPGQGFPEFLNIAAVVDDPAFGAERLKAIQLAEHAAREALQDARIETGSVDPDRFGCAVSGHMGDSRWLRDRALHVARPQGETPWWEQWLPNTSCWNIATKFGLYGPRICHSTACASGLIDFLAAVRSIQDNQCDIALAGSSEAIDPLFAAGFRRMRVLAEDPTDPQRACRPFDRTRNGFVMGEGAAMFVLERLSHALARNVPIYAEVGSGRMLADAHHVTGLDTDSDALVYLIHDAMRRASVMPADIGYVNAHGTGTLQNDLLEIRGLRRAMGLNAQDMCVSATKSMLGHLVNAAGSVELAITALAMRDRFVPPTLNLHNPDPECDLDCLPLRGRACDFDHALKLSIAFGGHLVAVLLRRWDDADSIREPAPQRAAA